MRTPLQCRPPQSSRDVAHTPACPRRDLGRTARPPWCQPRPVAPVGLESYRGSGTPVTAPGGHLAGRRLGRWPPGPGCPSWVVAIRTWPRARRAVMWPPCGRWVAMLDRRGPATAGPRVATAPVAEMAIVGVGTPPDVGTVGPLATPSWTLWPPTSFSSPITAPRTPRAPQLGRCPPPMPLTRSFGHRCGSRSGTGRPRRRWQHVLGRQSGGDRCEPWWRLRGRGGDRRGRGRWPLDHLITGTSGHVATPWLACGHLTAGTPGRVATPWPTRGVRAAGD
jgi:hypothetical protein